MKKIKILVCLFIVFICACVIYVYCKKGLIEAIGFAAYVAPIFSAFIAGAVYYEDSEGNTTQKTEAKNKNEDPQKKSYTPSLAPLFLGVIFQLIYIFKESINIEIYAITIISVITIFLGLALIKVSSNIFKSNSQSPYLRMIMIWGLAPYAIITALTIILLLQKIANQ